MIPRRIYIDLDPGYTQFWHATGNPGPRLEGHNFYYTVGENIGRPGCSIPTGGIPWRPIRQPVVLEHWPACATGDARSVQHDRELEGSLWSGPIRGYDLWAEGP